MNIFDKQHRAGLSLSLLLSALLPSAPAAAQTSVVPYQPGITQEGAVYYLPKTAIRVTVRVVKTTYTPGDFCKYAERYLRLTNVRTQPQTTHEVVAVSQMAVPVADTAKVFSVKFDPKSVAPNVVLSPDGCLLAMNAQAQPVELPLPFVAMPQKPAQNPRQFLNEDILSAGSTAKMAELTAQEIYDIRESRSLLVKGQADFMPKDGEQLRLMLNQLTEQDQALTSLFTGTVSRDTTEHVLTVVPTSQLDHHVLFRFSQRLGLVDADDLSGVPYYMSVTNLATVPAPDATASAKKKKTDRGVYVNVPSKMRSAIYCGNDLVDQAEMPAPQFGNTELLSDQLFNKHYTTHLWLNPVSGAVDKLQAEQPK